MHPAKAAALYNMRTGQPSMITIRLDRDAGLKLLAGVYKHPEKLTDVRLQHQLNWLSARIYPTGLIHCPVTYQIDGVAERKPAIPAVSEAELAALDDERRMQTRPAWRAI
jgi:hypothetical protein